MEYNHHHHRPDHRPILFATFSKAHIETGGIVQGHWEKRIFSKLGKQEKGHMEMLLVIHIASLLGATTLLVAPGIATSNKKLLVVSLLSHLLAGPGP